MIVTRKMGHEMKSDSSGYSDRLQNLQGVRVPIEIIRCINSCAELINDRHVS